MGHDNVWNSHPKNYGQGSRHWWVRRQYTLGLKPAARFAAPLQHGFLCELRTLSGAFLPAAECAATAMRLFASMA